MERMPSSSTSTSISLGRRALSTVGGRVLVVDVCACGPLGDEEMEEHCLIVVGSKTDLAQSSCPAHRAPLSQKGCVRLHLRR